jgi:hypothetical protein
MIDTISKKLCQAFFYPVFLLGEKGDMSPWNRRRPRLGEGDLKRGNLAGLKGNGDPGIM